MIFSVTTTHMIWARVRHIVLRYNVISIIDSVSPYKQLRGGLEIVEEIPKLPSGKILRRKIPTSGTV
jgi:acyl-coenzyme A synthetase/AMP-(fatty) acid ligase